MPTTRLDRRYQHHQVSTFPHHRITSRIRRHSSAVHWTARQSSNPCQQPEQVSGERRVAGGPVDPQMLVTMSVTFQTAPRLLNVQNILSDTSARIRANDLFNVPFLIVANVSLAPIISRSISAFTRVTRLVSRRLFHHRLLLRVLLILAIITMSIPWHPAGSICPSCRSPISPLPLIHSTNTN